MRWAFSAAVLVYLTGAAHVRAEQSLQWKFKAGDKINYVLEQGGDINVNASGVEFDVMLNQTMDTTWNVASVAADGTADIGLTVDRLQLMMNTPFTGEFKYDSKDGKEGEGQVWQMIGPYVKNIIGEQISLKMKPTGEVLEVKLPDKLVEALSSGRGGGGGGARSMMMGGGFGAETVKELIGQAIVRLPAEAVADNATWQANYETKMGPIGTQKSTFNYSYQGMQKKAAKELAKIGLSTELTFEPAQNEELDMEMEMTEQSGSGSVLFDPEAGRTVESTAKQKVVMEGDFMGNEFVQSRDMTVALRMGTSPVLLAGPKKLRWKFKEGETLNYAVQIKNKILVDAGAQFDVAMDQAMDLTWKVKSVAEDGSAELTQTIDRVQLMLNTPFTGEFSYDSKSDQPGEGQVWEVVGPLMEAMIGNEFQIKTSAAGEVTEVALPEKLVNILNEQAQGAGQMLAFLGAGISEDEIKGLIHQAVVRLPDPDVSGGETWEQTLERKLGAVGKETVKSTFTYGGPVAHDLKAAEKIGVKSEVSLELAEGGEVDVDIEITEQASNVDIFFDADTGRTIEMNGTEKRVDEGSFMGNEFKRTRESKLLVMQGTIDDLPVEEPPAEAKPAEATPAPTEPAAEKPAEEKPADK